MSKTKQLVTNTLFIALSRGVTQVSALVLIPLYTLHLSPEQYGLFDLITTYIFLLVPVVIIRAEMATFRLLVDARGHAQKSKLIISTALTSVLTIVAASAIFIILPLEFVIGERYLWPIYMYGAVWAISSVLMEIARGLGDNKRYAISNMFVALSKLLMTYVLIVMLDWGVVGALLGVAAAHLVAALYLGLSPGIRKNISLAIDKDTLKEGLSYSWPLVPNGAALWVISASDRTIVTLILGAAANGIYAISNRFSSIYMSIFSIFYTSWTESVSLHIKDDGDKFISRSFNHGFAIFSCIGLILISVCSLIFPYIVGDNFADAYIYIPILVVGTVVGSLVSLYGSIYIGLKLSRKVLHTTLLTAILNIALTIPLVYFIGIYGAAISTLLAYSIVAVIRHRDLRNRIHIKYNTGTFALIALLYTISMATYYANNAYITIVTLVAMMAASILINKQSAQYLTRQIVNRK